MSERTWELHLNVLVELRARHIEYLRSYLPCFIRPLRQKCFYVDVMLPELYLDHQYPEHDPGVHLHQPPVHLDGTTKRQNTCDLRQKRRGTAPDTTPGRKGELFIGIATD